MALDLGFKKVTVSSKKLYVYPRMKLLMDDIKHRIPPKPVRFLDQLKLSMRENGLAYRTEQTYIHWVKRFIYFHNKKHPKDMGIRDVQWFPSVSAFPRKD